MASREQGFLEKQVWAESRAGSRRSGLFTCTEWGAVVSRLRVPKISTLEPCEPHMVKGTRDFTCVITLRI